MHWYLEALKKYAIFTGRAREREYWTFALVNTGVLLVLPILLGEAGFPPEASEAAHSLFLVAVLLPWIAVSMRRLHDSGHSGWWLWIAPVPVLGQILLFLFFIADGQVGPNRFGPDPRGRTVPEPDGGTGALPV